MDFSEIPQIDSAPLQQIDPMDTAEMAAITIPTEETSSLHASSGAIIMAMTRKLIPTLAGVFIGLLLALGLAVHTLQTPATVSSDTTQATALAFVSVPPSTNPVQTTAAVAVPASKPATTQAPTTQAPSTSVPATKAPASQATQPATTAAVSVPEASAPTVPASSTTWHPTTTERYRNSTTSMGGVPDTYCDGWCQNRKNASTTTVSAP